MFPWQDILAGLFGGSVWRVCLAGLFGGSVWLIHLAGFSQAMKRHAVEQEKEIEK